MKKVRCAGDSVILCIRQLEESPLARVLPIKQIENALDYFVKNHSPPKFIIWHNSKDRVVFN